MAATRAPVVVPTAASAETGAAPVPRWRPAEKPAGMSWREREALKQAQGASNGDSAPPPPSAAPSERPRLNLARPSADRDREREKVPERVPERVSERVSERVPERELPARTGTPGDSEGAKPKYIPPSMRRRQEEDSSSATPPPPAADGESTGKYRPGMFGRRGGGAGMGQARRD